MAYTDEEIQSVCDQAADILPSLTDVQNTTFPSTAIMQAMKEDKTPDEIADAAYYAISTLPLTNSRWQMTRNNNIFNYAQIVRGVVLNAVKNI